MQFLLIARVVEGVSMEGKVSTLWSNSCKRLLWLNLSAINNRFTTPPTF